MLVGLAACAEVPEVEETELALVTSRGCDPDMCGPSGNGNGVYAEENGSVGIGANDFLITHFINHPVDANDPLHGVTLAGRYHDPNAGWVVSTGRILQARYDGVPSSLPPVTPYSVYSVGETYTVPTWKLGSTGSISVTDDNIENLEVDLDLDDGTDTRYYTLRFKNYHREALKVGVQAANASWRVYKTNDSFTAYCRRSALGGGTIDPGVFQQGIAINAVNAGVIRNSAFVTMSCLHGGPATVRMWGYTYRGTSARPDLFDAALLMKRASYCGDASYYTEAGTLIFMNDDGPINQDAVSVTEMEAQWGPDGATCVNMTKRRHPGLVYPTIGNGAEFNGWCHGVQLPPCTTAPYSQDPWKLASQRTAVVSP